MYSVVITKPAEQDLQKAVRYISGELQNPVAATALVHDMETAISSLAEMPRRNPLVREATLSSRGFRLIVVKNYLVFYVVRETENSVVIERILYGRRDWESLL